MDDEYVLAPIRKGNISVFLVAKKESEKMNTKSILNVEDIMNIKHKISILKIEDRVLSLFNELNEVEEFEIIDQRNFIALTLNFSIIPCLLKRNNNLYAIISLDDQPLLILTKKAITRNYLLVNTLDLVVEEIDEFPKGKMINHKLFAVSAFNAVRWKNHNALKY